MNADESRRHYAAVELHRIGKQGFKRAVRCASSLESEN
jgi:hypothetical protein